MLIVSRKINEEILIGGTIRVIVLRVHRQKVKLGLAAPRDVAIYRKEIGDGEPHATGAPSENDRQHPTPVEEVAEETRAHRAGRHYHRFK